MKSLRSGFIAFFALASLPAAAGTTPCEPSPGCALQIARDLAMKSIRPADSDDKFLYVVGTLEWAQGVAPEPEAAVRARFATLSERIPKIADEHERALAKRWLGIFMAKSGFIPEATKVADKLDNDGRNVVYANIAEEHARRGRWREAFRAVNEIHNEDPSATSKFFALRNSLKSVARTGQPALIEEAVSMAKDAPIGFLQTGFAWSDLYAGKDDAAVLRAVQQSDIQMRMMILMELENWYQDEKRDPDILRVERIQLELLREMSHLAWTDHLSLLEWSDRISHRYFDGLVKAGRLSEALAWAPQVPAEDRDSKLTSLFYDLRKSEDIAGAAKLGILISEKGQERAAEALAWARIASGVVEPSTGVASVANPGKFARHAVELLSDFDPALPDRGRAILAAAVDTIKGAPDKRPFENMFLHSALARAQIQFGLLDDARKTIDGMEYSDDRARWLLALSVAQSRAGKVEVARATKTEGMKLLAQVDRTGQPDSRAETLLRVGMFDDAETELRRLMIPDPLPPAFSRVGRPLVEEFQKRGETKRAFQLASDWSALDGDPEPIATFYSVATHSEHPPVNFSRTLNQFR